MNLIDRPFPEDPFHPHRRTGGAMASGAVHLVAALTLITLFRAIPEKASSAPPGRVIPLPPFVFLSHDNPGGGSDGGGDRSTAPRPIREEGRAAASAPNTAEPSDRTTNEPPEEIATLPVKPMGVESTPLAGAIDGNPAATALGPGDRGAGTTTGNDTGIGHGRGPGIGDAYRLGGPGVTTPTVITQVKPRYTVEAMRLRIQGSVWVECIVMPDGSVAEPHVIRSLDPRFGLDDEAIAAAKQWRFRPGTVNGKPVPVVVSIELMFSVR